MSKLQAVFGLVVGVLATLGLFGVIQYPSFVQVPFVSLFVAVWLFTGGIHAKQMYEVGEIDSFLKWMYAPLVVVVILVDVFFNATWGTIIYRELPKEWLFTTRTKRHYYTQIPPEGMAPKMYQRYQAAQRWAYRLNAIDPGHV